MLSAAAVVGIHACLMFSAAGQDVSEVVSHHDAATGLTILRANVSLPAAGYWFADPEKNAGSSLGDVFLISAHPERLLQDGKRMARRAEQKELQTDRWPLDRLGWSIREYSTKNKNTTPKSLDEIGDHLDVESRAQLKANYLVLKDLAIDPRQSTEKSGVVAFETKPLIDDGKHWVLLSNGVVERRAIDAALVKSNGVKIQPRRLPLNPTGEESKQVEFVMHARVLKDAPAVVILKNPVLDQTIEIRIDPAKAKSGERDVMAKWAMSRMWSMAFLGDGTTSAILPYWLRQAGELYGAGAEDFAMARKFGIVAERGNTTGIFNVLGGRAAIQETLQLQDIQTNQDKESNARETPITRIQGVEVKSHPFEEMLGNKPGGHIPLANVIPADRLFAYFPKPSGLISWLDGGAEFLFNTGASATGRSLEYGLSERYIAALGMNRDWMKRLLDSGAVEEIAVMMPDLFLIDGTEVTAVARLKNPMIATGLLQLLGIRNIDTQTVRKGGANGETSHWAKRGDLLIISTDARELENVLALQAAGGKDSLGQSAELRYMLTKLAPQDSTRAFVYLSDPFIRRLVGPETKIAQHRRVRARGEMEGLVAGSLLYRLDGHDNGTMAEMMEKHYIPKPLVATDAALDPKCGAVSKMFGALPRMHSLMDLGITHASSLEAEAYKQYLENYNRYWRRYFDPIALRLDQPDPGSYELSVFILPLIDNSIYNGLRSIIADGSDGAKLKIPLIEPEPVAMLSMNLSEQTWTETGGEMLEEFMRHVGIDGAILDSMGPDVHVAIADADPILEMGSGELTQAFGSHMDNSEMALIPAIVSMFTRPTAVCAGLKDPAAVRRALDASVGRKTGISGNDISGSLYKVAERDAWIYRISFFDMISLRLGIEVQGRFLVIRNMPLTTPLRIAGVRESDLPGAAMCLSPRACRLQLPALFASAAERERSAAFNGMADLQPLLLTGARSVGEAAEQHKAWFGFRPRHPGGGGWNWDGRTMTSTRYGTPRYPKQPDYKADDRDFGALRRVDNVDVGMRFEEDGLRSVVRWKMRAVKPLARD